MDMTEKSPGAYRTISEVSDQLDVPQHVLRFWETKFPQVAPMKRAGNRRYYNPEHIDLLGRIRDLLYVEGYTTKGVQKLLEEGRLMEGAAPASAEPAGPSGNLMDLTAQAQPAPQSVSEPAPMAQEPEEAQPTMALTPSQGGVVGEVVTALQARLQAARDRLSAALES